MVVEGKMAKLPVLLQIQGAVGKDSPIGICERTLKEIHSWMKRLFITLFYKQFCAFGDLKIMCSLVVNMRNNVMSYDFSNVILAC